MDYGDAIRIVKTSGSVRRVGWKENGMFVFMMDRKHGARENMLTKPDNIRRNIMPCIAIVTAAGEVQPGWVASQPDMIANDWEIVLE